jgi:molybdopterin/thiamine biosynthesis adenylyltransferase
MGFSRRGRGWIRVADGDIFEASNLNRQLFCLESNLGLPKTQEAVQRILAVNSEVDLQACRSFLRSEDLPAFIDGADLVLDALGDLPTKLALRRAAARAGLPVVTAAVGGWVGFISTLLPLDLDDALLRLMGAQTDVAAESHLGVLAPTAWLVAALQCREAVALACSQSPLFHGRVQIVDLSDASWEMVTL